jgi:hypothetical protein
MYSTLTRNSLILLPHQFFNKVIDRLFNRQKDCVGNACLQRQVRKHSAEIGKGNTGRRFITQRFIHSIFIHSTHLPRPCSKHKSRQENQEFLPGQVPVAHTYNPSYSWSRDQEDHSLKPSWANNSWDSISKKPITEKGLAESLKVKALSSSPSPAKKKNYSCLTCEIYAAQPITHEQPAFQSLLQTRKQRWKEMWRKAGDKATDVMTEAIKLWYWESAAAQGFKKPPVGAERIQRYPPQPALTLNGPAQLVELWNPTGDIIEMKIEKLAPITTSPERSKRGVFPGNHQPIGPERAAPERQPRRVRSKMPSCMPAIGLESQGHYSPLMGPCLVVTRSFIWDFAIHLGIGPEANLETPVLYTLGTKRVQSWGATKS